MATFNGQTFTELDPKSATQQEITAEVSVRRIPGSVDNVIDISGPTPRTLNLAVKFADEDAWLNFKAQAGVEASLVYSGGTVTALLTSASVEAPYAATTVRFGSARFIITVEG